MTDLLVVLAFVASLFAAMANAARAYNAQVRGRLHLLYALLALYFAAVYGLTLIGMLPPSGIGATYLRPALVVLMVALGTAAIAYWRRD